MQIACLHVKTYETNAICLLVWLGSEETFSNHDVKTKDMVVGCGLIARVKITNDIQQLLLKNIKKLASKNFSTQVYIRTITDHGQKVNVCQKSCPCVKKMMLHRLHIYAYYVTLSLVYNQGGDDDKPTTLCSQFSVHLSPVVSPHSFA